MAKKKQDDLDIEIASEDEETAPKRQGKRAEKKKKGFLSSMADETVQGVAAVAAFVLAIFTSLAIWGKAGVVGRWTFTGLGYLLGVGYYLLPLIFVVLALTFLRNLHRRFESAKLYGAGLFLVSILGIIDIVSPAPAGSIP
ncbi:MAG TPA: hypothetical protein VFQ72_00040, partial [Candidatus Paceibacterota bacterium]|nr:hypothetical protein [Candidatus Paceibacterota bacterium]